MNGAIMKDNGIDKDTDNPWWTTYEKINIFTRDNVYGNGDIHVFRELGARLLGPELDHTEPWPPPTIRSTERSHAPSRRPCRRRTAPDQFERDYTEMAAGSCLVTFGRTRVLCTASIDDDVPRWMRGSGKGWVTAEYSMLPGASPERIDPRSGQGQAERADRRDPAAHRPLAACRVRHDACSASVRWSSIATSCRPTAAHARRASAAATSRSTTRCSRVLGSGAISAHPLHSFCSAISVGIVDGTPVLDLPYVEDSRAEVDMNVVMLTPAAGGEARFVEVQGTAEGMAFTRGELDQLLGLAESGLREITDLQREWSRVAAADDDRRRRRAALAARVRVGESRQGRGDRRDPRRRGRPLAAPARCPTSWRTPTRSSATPA